MHTILDDIFLSKLAFSQFTDLYNKILGISIIPNALLFSKALPFPDLYAGKMSQQPEFAFDGKKSGGRHFPSAKPDGQIDIHSGVITFSMNEVVPGIFLQWLMMPGLEWKKEKRFIMSDMFRVAPGEIYQRVKSGDCLLVCAYDNEETFQSMRLEGAISLEEFKRQVSRISKDQEIVFYCAWKNEHSSAGLADEYQKHGFKHAKALLGGVAAWKQAGFPIIPAEA